MPPKRPRVKRSGIRMTKRSKLLLDRYAASHYMSRSEVICEIIDGVLHQKPKVVPQRRDERVTFYDPDDRLSRLNAKATLLGIDGTDLLERAIEESLGG